MEELKIDELEPVKGYFLAGLTETDEGAMDSVETETSLWVKVVKVGRPIEGWEPDFSEGDTVRLSALSGKRLLTDIGYVIPMPITSVICVKSSV